MKTIKIDIQGDAINYEHFTLALVDYLQSLEGLKVTCAVTTHTLKPTPLVGCRATVSLVESEPRVMNPISPAAEMSFSNNLSLARSHFQQDPLAMHAPIQCTPLVPPKAEATVSVTETDRNAAFISNIRKLAGVVEQPVLKPAAVPKAPEKDKVTLDKGTVKPDTSGVDVLKALASVELLIAIRDVNYITVPDAKYIPGLLTPARDEINGCMNAFSDIGRGDTAFLKRGSGMCSNFYLYSINTSSGRVPVLTTSSTLETELGVDSDDFICYNPKEKVLHATYNAFTSALRESYKSVHKPMLIDMVKSHNVKARNLVIKNCKRTVLEDLLVALVVDKLYQCGVLVSAEFAPAMVCNTKYVLMYHVNGTYVFTPRPDGRSVSTYYGPVHSIRTVV